MQAEDLTISNMVSEKAQWTYEALVQDGKIRGQIENGRCRYGNGRRITLWNSVRKNRTKFKSNKAFYCRSRRWGKEYGL